MPFVGRRRELDRLDACLGAAAQGRGRLVLISGEPGVGKTSLARELAASAAQRGMVVLRAACFEGEWQPPYRLWADILAQQPDGAEVLARLDGTGGATAPPLAADDERRRLFDAVVAWLLGRASEQPAVVLLEDLQWVDADSLALFRRVARAAGDAPLLIVGTHRSGAEATALDDLLAHLAREAEPERVVLSGLSRDEVGQYLETESAGAVPGALVNAIHDETGGNPFFVREVLTHLVEERKIARRAGRWTTAASIAELGIPPGVRQVVRQRVARLSPTAQRVLRLAAAFTTGVEAEVLASAADLPVATVLDGLDEGVAAGLLEGQNARRSRYDFAHAIVRHALYEDLGAAARRDLHGLVALALEANPPTPGRTAELAAQHYQAGSVDGVRHCLAAAEQARQAAAHQQAVRFLHMALDLAATEAPDARLTARVAVAEAEALQLDAAAVTAARALDLFDTADADEQEVLAFVVTVARLLKESGALPAAWEPLVQRGLDLAGDRRDVAWARLQLLVTPMVPFSEGPVHAGRWLGHDPEVCALARQGDAEEDGARTVEAWDWRTPAEVEVVLEQGRRWHRPAAVLRVYEMANRTYLFRHGDLHRAEELMRELLDLGRQWGSAAAQGEALTQLALCHAFLGLPDQASAELSQARAIVEPLGALHRQNLAVSVSHAVLIGYLAGTGEWEAWGERAAGLIARPLVSRSAPLGLILAGLGALSFARAGRADRAIALVDPLTALLERADTRDYGATGAMWMVVAACWHLRRPHLVRRHAALVDRFEADGLVAGPFTCWSHVRARLTALADEEASTVQGLFAGAVGDLEAAGHRALAAIAAVEAKAAADDPRPPPAAADTGPLTPREAEILGLIAAGHTNAEIADQLHVSVPTVNRHVANVYLKIGARNRATATAYALSHGLA